MRRSGRRDEEEDIIHSPHDVFCIQIRQFATINLKAGRDGGDYVLAILRKRLHTLTRGQGKLIPLSGKEFAFIRYGNHSVEANLLFGQRIVAHMESPVYWAQRDGEVFMPSVRVGVSMGHQAGERWRNSLHKAEQAAFAARESDEAIVLYSQAVQERINAILESEALVQDALYKDRVRYVVQPKVDTSGRIIGGEVLMRLRKDDGTLLSPDKFIPVAERNGHIVALGESILLSSATLLTSLPPSIHLAVNVSPIQLRFNDFEKSLERILHLTGIDSRRLELEITESASLNSKRVLNTLNAIKRMGVRLAIDDFGTSYSSLSHLRAIPADTLKIDRSFVQNIHSENGYHLVYGIAQLAKGLGMSIVAEGVETPQQAEILRNMGCDMMQGYGFYKPMATQAFQKLVKHPEETRHVCAVSTQSTWRYSKLG